MYATQVCPYRLPQAEALQKLGDAVDMVSLLIDADDMLCEGLLNALRAWKRCDGAVADIIAPHRMLIAVLIAVPEFADLSVEWLASRDGHLEWLVGVCRAVEGSNVDGAVLKYLAAVGGRLGELPYGAAPLGMRIAAVVGGMHTLWYHCTVWTVSSSV